MYRKWKLKQIKNFILVIASLFIVFSCENEKIDENQISNKHEVNQKTAEIVALNVFKDKKDVYLKTTEITKTIANVTTYKIPSSSDVNAFYVFNYNEGGFSIISADDRINPVLAYCDEGNFSTNIDEVPEPVQSWMEEEKEMSQMVKVENLEQIPEIKLDWDNALNKLPPVNDPSDWCVNTFYQKGPLLTTAWGQWSSYNNLVNSGNCTPNWYNAGKAPTGCVATAMAQIMKYWHKPNSYNWSNMPNNGGTIDTQNINERYWK